MLWNIRGLSEATQRTYLKRIKTLMKQVDLNSPEIMEKHILSFNGTNKYKNQLFIAYQHFCDANGTQWKMTKLKEDSYPVKVATEERINMIIASATPKYALVFSLSKHGLRPDEISKITVRDLDLDRKELVVRTSKLGKERTLKLKSETVDMLRDYIALHKPDLNERIFVVSRKMRQAWNKARRKAYEKFRDPELLKIRLYDLRHWYGTMIYVKTHDPFYVQYQLGHKHITSTMRYVHLAKGLTNYSEDYICKIAQNLNEACQLVEVGFEYVTDYQDKKLFRKRK